jgi:hypothetical protein
MARTNRVAALAKVETTYGVDAVPTGAANAILLQEAEVTPMEAERIERPLIRPYFGARPYVLAGKRMRLSATVDLAGAGAAGDIPAFGALLRGCAMAQTVVPATRVDYTPVSSGEESLTLIYNLDGTQHRGLGGRGTWSLELNANAFPRLRLEYQAFFTQPTAVALPSVTLTAWRDPRPVGFVDTPLIEIDGFSALAMESVRYTHANDVVYRDLVGTRSVQITGRTPAATVSIEAPALATKNFFAIADAQTPVLVRCQQGTSAGNIAEISLPRVQILNPRYRDSDGIAMLDMDLVPLPNAGDDEITLSIR